MKKNILTLLLAAITCGCFAQNNNMLVRHDSTLLKAAECEWLIKSLTKNDPALTSEIGKPVSLIILESIKKGKLKAIDPETNKPIPAKEIFTWKMTADTLPEYNDEGNIIRYMVIKREHSSDNINQIRIYQDWYFDIATGKFVSVIKWIELLEEIYTPSAGIFIGYAALCRIYY